MSVFKEDISEIFTELLDWMWSVAKHWRVLATGGTVIAADWAMHGWRQTEMTKTEFCLLAAIFLLIACFRSWRDQRRDRMARESELAKTRESIAGEEMRKIIKDVLGISLKMINERLRLHKASQWCSFDESKLLEAWEGFYKLIGFIEDFLAHNLSRAEAEYFSTIADMKQTPVLAVKSEVQTVLAKQFHNMNDLLEHYSKRLQFIIEKKM